MRTSTVEMVVSLKVPDTTAVTALQTLQKLGFNRIHDVKRSDYYKFLIEEYADKFKEKIRKVDIIVNVNKHFFEFSIQKSADIKILVKNIDDDGNSLLSILKSRLGIKGIKKAEKSTLWSLKIDSNEKEARKIAERAAKELLVNENYQECSIL